MYFAVQNAMKVFLLLFFLSFSVKAEFIEIEYTSGGHQIRLEGLSNFKYPLVSVEEDKLLLVTHASKYWDTQGMTWKGISPLIRYFNENHLPLKTLVSIHEKAIYQNAEDQDSYFPNGTSVESFHPFQGDSHRIVFKGRNVVVAGGNFTICACNALRSVIAHSETKETLNVFLPLDGIYEGQGGRLRTLHEISNENDDRKFLQYLIEDFFNADGLPCKEPSLYSLDRSFTYRIFRKGKFIGRFGEGKTLVRIYFEGSDQIIRKLEDL
ncbi:MAG: hypothetical protein ACLGHN_04295 [Bacteriovoracia bacterium]